ncbi:Autolysin sensor kinase [Labilithrix luteola]|uniref:histidine kinase n=1 Tax=Labilithrix luteola TaxID=1391654 RepID=A0A0K1Q0M1_9BACT|nr:histidine kinase [Labilithrix luteola]AKU98959.1 Autolysin sensor kinase [Labilithrix luteola]
MTAEPKARTEVDRFGEVHLDRPLPSETFQRVNWGPAGYASYPVFSAPWLRRRSMTFGIALSAIGVLVGVAVRVTDGETVRAVMVALHFVVGGLLVSSLGPLLATIVRHRRLGADREPAALLVALAIGTFSSFLVDRWASAGIERHLGLSPSITARVSATSSAPMPAPEKDGGDDLMTSAASAAFGLLVYGLAGGWLAVGRYFREIRRAQEIAIERERADRDARQAALDTRLALLQAQVEPHFLFNTLSSVRSLVTTEPERARATIDALADYLRATIPRLRRDATSLDSSLGQQLDVCESYLALMRVRMGERLSSRIQVEPRLRSLSFPPLVLVTLVENAIRHGVEPKVGPASIVVDAALDTDASNDDWLEVRVTDDGMGLREGFGTGVGLGNIVESLAARHGDRARFSLSGAPGRGAVAIVRIPALRTSGLDSSRTT